MTKFVDGIRSTRPHNRPINSTPYKKPTAATPPISSSDEIYTSKEPLKPGHGLRPQRAVRSIDGMVIPSPRTMPVPKKVDAAWKARPRVGFDTPKFIDDPIAKGKAHTKSSKMRRLLALLQYPLIAVITIVAVYSTSIGQWLVVAYAIYALVRRIDSKSTFIAALVLLAGIPLFQILNQPGVSENIAIYTYELLVVGTLQAIVELGFASKNKRSVVQSREQ